MAKRTSLEAIDEDIAQNQDEITATRLSAKKARRSGIGVIDLADDDDGRKPAASVARTSRQPTIESYVPPPPQTKCSVGIE